MRPWMLAFGGGSGSGKTTVRKLVAEHFRKAGRVLLDIRFDNYYRDQSYLPRAERDRVDYDDPATVDLALLRRNLQLLRQGESVQNVPLYDMKSHTRLGYNALYLSRENEIILVDGIFSLLLDDPQDDGKYDDGKLVFDFRVFFEADREMCLERRIERDVKERGRKKAQAKRQWEETVYPGFLRYVMPQRERADVVVEWKHEKKENEEMARQLFKFLHERYLEFRTVHPY